MQKENLLFLGGPLHEQFHEIPTNEVTMYVIYGELLTKAMAHRPDCGSGLTASQVFKHCYERMAFILKSCCNNTTSCIYYYMEYVGYNKYEYFFTKEQEFFDNLFKGVK